MSLTRSLASADLAHLIHPLTSHRRLARTGPEIVVAGEGCELLLEDGRRLLDGAAGLWCVNLGHGRKEIVAAAAEQMQTLAYSSTFGGLSNRPAIELAERLTGLAPGGLTGVFFASGGSEANETAIKLARFYWMLEGSPGKTILLTHDRGYHGLAHASTTATGLDAYHRGFGPPAPDIERIPAPYLYRCAAGIPCDPATCPVCGGIALERRIDEIGADRIAAVMVEPVLGAGGVIVPPEGYLRALREVCDRRRVLLILDEVITAFGRTGRWFGAERDGIVPDMITFAKGITSGYVPLGGVLVGEAIWSALRSAPDELPLMHGFTYSGHPVCCAVALAVLDVIERDDLVAQTAERGTYLAKRLEDLLELPEVGEVRSLGLLAGIELVADRATRARFPASAERGPRVGIEARNRGLLTRCLLDDIPMLAPPFIVSEREIDTAVDALAQAIVATRDEAERLSVAG